MPAKRVPWRLRAVNSEATSTIPAASLTSSMVRCEILNPGLLLYRTTDMRVVWTRGNVTLPGMDIRDGSAMVPSAGYADLPPGIGFESKDEPLRRDINLLGRVLGRILIEQEGKDLFESEEEVRLLCKRLRFDYDPELDERLRRMIDAMSVEELRRIVRAFSVYFQLVNIAERYHRVRRRRQYESAPDNPPQRASVASALARLKSEGLGKEALRSVLEEMSVGLVMTGHPTEGQAQAREDRGVAPGYGVARSHVEGAKASRGGPGRGDYRSVADRRAQGPSSRGKPRDRADTTVLREPFDLRNARGVQGLRRRVITPIPGGYSEVGSCTRIRLLGRWRSGRQSIRRA